MDEIINVKGISNENLIREMTNHMKDEKWYKDLKDLIKSILNGHKYVKN